jgi:hypothetical protein
LRGLIIPTNIKTFNDAIVTDYYEQQELPTTGNRSPGMSMKGDISIPNQVDKNTEAQFPQSDDCGCSGGSSMGISFEYKILVVLILIILIWTFVSWRHHHMVAH